MRDISPDWFSPSTHPIYQAVTRIRFPNKEGHATGFFYNTEDNTHLITNRHVFDESDDSNNNSDSVRIFIRSVDAIQQREYHDLSISDGENEDWFSHPSDSNIDIAVVPLEFELDSINPRIGIYDERPPETGSLAFNTDSILSEKSRVLAGDRAQIVGYPGHYTDQMYDFPVTRNAIVSTQYGFPYNGAPAFLTDARMHPGTSGSPVLAGPVTLITHGGIDLWGPAYKLLGVHSSTLLQPVEESERRWLDLNTSWYAELIEEIAETIETNE